MFAGHLTKINSIQQYLWCLQYAENSLVSKRHGLYPLSSSPSPRGRDRGKIHIKHEGLSGKRMVCVQTMIEPNLDGKKELVLKQMTFG